MTLNQIASLFARDKSVISRHLSKIFETLELEKDSVVANFATTASDGKTYQVDYYNLDAILSIGYRVNSKEGIHYPRENMELGSKIFKGKMSSRCDSRTGLKLK